MNRTSEKSAFPYWNLVHSSISLQFSPPAAKKVKTKRFYTPPLGGKKTTEFVSPQKESFGKSKGVWVDFLFKVGGKIGWVDFVFKVSGKIDL